MSLLNSFHGVKMLIKAVKTSEQAKRDSEELKDKLLFAMDANKNKQEVAHVVTK